MEAFFGFLVMIAVLLLVGVPVAKILGKAGYSRWLVILYFVPLVNLVMLWVFAFGDWPALRGRAGAST